MGFDLSFYSLYYFALLGVSSTSQTLSQKGHQSHIWRELSILFFTQDLISDESETDRLKFSSEVFLT